MKKTKKNIFKNLKDRIALMDRKVLLIIIALIALIVLVVLLLIFMPRTTKCEQKVDIEGVTNVNTVEITHKRDVIKEVKTTFNYEIDSNKDTDYFKLVKKSMKNLGEVYKTIDGVEFKITKDKDNKFQTVQIVDFGEVSNKDLSNIGIVRSHKEAKKNYEAAGYTCK